MGTSIEALLRELAQEFWGALWPERCLLCGEPAAGTLCTDHQLSGVLPGKRCGRCAARISDALPAGETCADCRRRRPAFQRTLALADYGEDQALRDWILAFKHGGRPELAEALASLCWARQGAALREVGDALLVPVPLHPLRRLERGHDQALELARQLGHLSSLPVEPLLRRRRCTPPQGGPGASSRAANVRDAFAPRWRAARRLADRPCWLVDDVLTSGATASACARLLRASGASWVGVLVLARA